MEPKLKFWIQIKPFKTTSSILITETRIWRGLDKQLLEMQQQEEIQEKTILIWMAKILLNDIS
jgi:hypothetical protein